MTTAPPAGWFVRAAAAALVVALVTPVAHASQDELEQTETDLEEARRELTEVEETLRRAAAAVDRSEAALAEASARLEQVRAELATAEAAFATAAARDRRAAARLLAATERLDEQESEAEALGEQLDQRAAEAYKRSSTGTSSALLFHGMAGARDLHDMAVAVRTVERVLAADTRLTNASQAASAAALEARNRVFELRADAKAAARDAAFEQQRVRRLEHAQESLVASIEEEVAARAAALASIEEDRVAQAVLVRQLEARVATLRFDDAAALLAANADAPIDGPSPPWAVALPPAGQRWAPALAGVAERVGVEPRLFAALVWAESNFQPAAVSRAGALGLAQLMPATAAGLGVDPFDPIENLTGGARYLRIQLQRFGRVDLALAAYNAGPHRVTAAGNRIPRIVETQLYVVRVLDRYEQLAAVGA